MESGHMDRFSTQVNFQKVMWDLGMKNVRNLLLFI